MRFAAFVAGCGSLVAAKKLGTGAQSDYGPSGWRRSYVTSRAEMAPAASAISLTRGERCVLRQGDMSLREAAAVCADEVDASSDLEKRRCAIHTQMHSACMDTNVSSQTVFWHGRSESGPHLSTGDSFARLAERGFSAVYFWGDSTAVADVHHLLCELLRAGFDVGERDAAAVGADLRRRIGDAPLENATKLHHWIRLPFRTLEACRDGRCIELHAMRIFRVSELPPALMGAYLRATLEASTRRVAHVFNQGLYAWPPRENPTDFADAVAPFLDRVDASGVSLSLQPFF